MSKRIDKVFADKKKKLVTFITGGDPDKNTSIKILKTIIQSGADIIEIGMPFSDPMAEGPSIQRGHERSLLNKTSLNDILKLVSDFRVVNIKTPLVLMGYFNPFAAFGVKKFFKLASEAGVDGVLVVDMPLEESKQFNESAKENGVDIIRLIAPTTTILRAKKILKSASGYIYYVSLNGVTGSNRIDLFDVNKKLRSLNNITKLPVVVGFGIKDRDTVEAASKLSSGVVVGSVLVDIMGSSKNESQITNLLLKKLNELTLGLGGR